MSLHLLVPGPFDAISGGYIYDRRMVEGLRALGETVEVVELPGSHPAPDEAATEGARAALHALPAGARIVIDGYAPDGTPEAIYVKDATGFTLSVQWHPEWRAGEDPVSRPLFQAFGRACADWAAGQRKRLAAAE